MTEPRDAASVDGELSETLSKDAVGTPSTGISSESNNVGKLFAAEPLLQIDAVATAMLVISLAIGSPQAGVLRGIAAVVSLAMFVAGLVVYVVAFVAGAHRSRTHELGIGSWFFLAGSAPKSIARWFRLLLAAQSVAGITAASIAPFTPVAFGVLAPIFGLSIMGLWGARHGTFARRVLRPGMRR
jgi:hypothetical protein